MTSNRRQFLAKSSAMLCTLASPTLAYPWGAKSSPGGRDDIRGTIFKNDAPKELWKWHAPALFQSHLADKKVRCGICPNRCLLEPGDRSVCRSRINHQGTLISLAYGNACAIHIDPVEKKPLFHFKPGSSVFSMAATGCNFRCLNCQNWEISQAKPHEVRFQEIFPAQIVKKAIESKSTAIAYTYSEATTYYEYMLDTAKLASQENIDNLWVSNGYINEKPLLELCKVIKGANVNLKSFSDDLYKRLNGGRLQPVLNTFKTLHEQKVHFEMTNLVVPGYVDKDDMVKQMCDWILSTLGPDHPLHFLRFFPLYKLDRLSPTPISTLTRFRDLAMEAGIRYVYVGNVPGHEGRHTYCHHCKKLLIKREGYLIPTNNLIGNRCSFCNTIIPGIWS